MRKKLLAFLSVFALVFSIAVPAHAASLSGAEQQVLDKFKGVLDYWEQTTDFDEDHVQQYYKEAERALLAVDLSDEACKEFEGVVDQVNQVFKDHNCKTRHELWECIDEILPMINNVGAKYYKLHVTVSGHVPETFALGHCTGHWAEVTWEIDGQESTVATTGNIVRQTGFGLLRTVGVCVASLTVLCSAYGVAHKRRLFEA